MRIRVKEPVTGTDLDLNAEPEDYNGEQGWRIIFPSKDSFVIVYKNGDWAVMDDDTVNPEIVETIGKAVHAQAPSKHTSQTRA